MKTGGYQAEYGRNTGGVINVITKSGGNEFHGGVFGYYNDTGMRADQENGKPENYATPQFSAVGRRRSSSTTSSPRTSGRSGAPTSAASSGRTRSGSSARTTASQSTRTSRRSTSRTTTTFGHDFPISLLPEQVLGQADVQPVPGHLDRRQRLLRLADAAGRARSPIPTSLNPISYAGRRDTGGPDYAARLNQLFGSFGIFTFQYAQHKDRYNTKPDGLDTAAASRLHGLPTRRPADGVPRGRRAASAASSARPSTTPPRVRPSTRRSRRTWATTRSRSAATTRTTPRSAPRTTRAASATRVRPCLQTGSSICDLALAPFYDNASGARTTTARSSTSTTCSSTAPRTTSSIIPALPVQHADQALQRLHPGPVADHPDADAERRRAVRHRGLLRLRSGSRDRRVQGLHAEGSVGAARRHRVGLRRATARRSCTLRPAASSSPSRRT